MAVSVQCNVQVVPQPNAPKGERRWHNRLTVCAKCTANAKLFRRFCGSWVQGCIGPWAYLVSGGKALRLAKGLRGKGKESANQIESR